MASDVTEDSSSPSRGSCWQDTETWCILPVLTRCSQAHCRLSDSCDYQWQMPGTWGLEHYFCIYINTSPVSLKHVRKKESLNIVFASWQEGQSHVGWVFLHEEKRYCWKLVAFIVTWNLSTFWIQRNWRQNPRESVCLAVKPGSWQSKPMWHHAWLVVCQIWQPQKTEKGRECQKAGRLPAQHLHLQSGEQGVWKVQEFIRSGEGVGQFNWCAVGNQHPWVPLGREGRKCLQLSQRKWKVFRII